MPRFFRRLLLLSIVCAGCAFGQGTFGQIAYGGSWQTTFTLVNMDSVDIASVTLSFFGDDGSPLNAPVQGFGNTSSYAFTILPNGSTNVVLSSTDSTTTQGWASIAATGPVRGQGSFRFLLPGGQISEAVVPLTPNQVLNCIALCIPPSLILLPFDNTTGQYVTSIALANTASTTQSVGLEFDDQSGNPLVTDTLNLTANQHMAFVTPQKYLVLANKKGVLRIVDNTTVSGGVGGPFSVPAIPITALGLLSNATNAVTTIIPIIQ